MPDRADIELFLTSLAVAIFNVALLFAASLYAISQLAQGRNF